MVSIKKITKSPRFCWCFSLSGDMLERYNGAGIGRDLVGGHAEGEPGCVEADSTGFGASWISPERSPQGWRKCVEKYQAQLLVGWGSYKIYKLPHPYLTDKNPGRWWEKIGEKILVGGFSGFQPTHLNNVLGVKSWMALRNSFIWGGTLKKLPQPDFEGCCFLDVKYIYTSKEK